MQMVAKTLEFELAPFRPRGVLVHVVVHVGFSSACSHNSVYDGLSVLG